MCHICPPGSGSGFRIRIRIHWPDWIWIQSGSATLVVGEKFRQFYILVSFISIMWRIESVFQIWKYLYWSGVPLIPKSLWLNRIREANLLCHHWALQGNFLGYCETLKKCPILWCRFSPFYFWFFGSGKVNSLQTRPSLKHWLYLYSTATFTSGPIF